MKNTDKYLLKKCVVMALEEYESLINDVTGGLKIVTYDCGDLSYIDTDEAEESETYWDQDIMDTLSDFFGVEVTSIHADNFEYICVWICYEEDN